MTCKDCLHYDVCEELEQKNGIPKTFTCQCAFFKNKSDYAEVVHGEWIEIKHGNGIFDYSFRCKNCCGETPIGYAISPNYCPNCGAKMDAKNDFNKNN